MTPNFVDSPLSSLFNYEYIYTYDNTEKIPTVKEGADSTGITFSYQYLDLNYEEAGWISGCPTDASNYEIIITATGTVEGSCKVKMTINPKKIKTKLIEITYSEASSYNSVDCRYWIKFSDELLNDKIVFTDENGATLPSSLKPNFKIVGMTTGDENCEYSTANDIVIGSTYLVNISLIGSSATNFVLYDNETYYSTGKASYGTSGCAVLKYKTVLYNSQYYTIEDVIGKNGDIVIVGDNSNTIFTAFTSFSYYSKMVDDKLSYSLNSNSNLWVTYNGSKTPKSNDSGSNIYSCLYIPSNVILDAAGNIYVCGSYEQTTHASFKKGVLFNNGTINLSGSLYSYGFTKGAGFIDALSGSAVYDMMRFYNYTGSGGITMTMTNTKIFPLSVYSMHNNSCKTKFDANSTFYVTYDVTISDISMQDNLTIVGTGGLFDLSDGYLIKSVEDTTGSFYSDKSVLKTNYNKTNQDKTQREVLDIYGTFSDNIVSISKSGKGITTGPDYAMPMGFINISLKDDGEGNVGHGTLSANSYKFYPGSIMTVDEGTTFIIASGINVIFYDETFTETIESELGYANTISYGANHSAWYSQTMYPVGSQLIINGSLISNGSLGGYIQTSSTTGLVQLATTSAKLIRLTKDVYSGGMDAVSAGLGTLKDEYTTDTVYATGYIDTNDNSTFNAGLYISEYTDYYYWTNADSAEKFILYFYDKDTNQKLAEKSVYVLEPVNNQYVYTIVGNEYIPSKDYFVFDAWFLQDGSKLSESNNKLIYNIPTPAVEHDPITINLYAGWTPITYSFEFIGIYVDPVTSENIILTEDDGFSIRNYADIKFSYNDIVSANISIPFIGEYLTCDFNGWYISANSNTILIENTLTLENFSKFTNSDLNENLNEKTGVITLVCRFTDYQEYTIQFDDALEEYEDQESLSEVNPYLALELPNINDFNYINEYQTYIMYWSYSPRKADNAVVNSGMTANTILELIEEYNSTASETDKINVVNNTIVLYAITDLKEFTISYYNDSSLKKTHYYNNNYPVTVADGTDSSGNDLTKADENKTTYFVGYIFDGWTLSTNKEDVLSVNDVIWPSGNIILNSHYAEAKYCTLNATLVDNVTLGITYVYKGNSLTESVASGVPVKFDYNSNITFNFSFATDGKDKPGTWSYTITGATSDPLKTESGNLSSSTVSKSYTHNNVIENISISTTWKAGSNSCVAEGTLITLADGTLKKVEDITQNDKLLVFNHETGELDVGYYHFNFHSNNSPQLYRVINLVFSNGEILRIISSHMLYDCTVSKYVNINEENVNNYIGHSYYSTKLINENFVSEIIKLESYYISEEYIRVYGPTTKEYTNCFTNAILTATPLLDLKDHFINIFEFDTSMSYNKEQIINDINKYGYYEYNDFKGYITIDEYENSFIRYVKIGVEKGLFTFDEVLKVLKYWQEEKIIV